MTASLVQDFLEQSAGRCPDKTAVFHGPDSATYAYLNTQANRLTHSLISAGLNPGDRVLMVMENSIPSVIAYYAILKAGGICVEVSDRSTAHELAYFFQDADARIVILSANTAKRLKDANLPLVIAPEGYGSPFWQRRLTWEDALCAPDTPPMVSTSPHELAAIVYTSGSTGRPKGVMLSHANLCANTASIVSYLGITSADRIMAVLPFFYVYGKTLLNTHFSQGGSLVINNRFVFPNTVIKEMIERKVTGFAGVPSTFAMLMNRSSFAATPLPSLRYVTQAGGAMAPSLSRKVMEAVNPADLFVMYGATEASARLAYLPPEQMKDGKLGSVGIAIPDVTISIRDDEGRELPPMQTGNICASGPNIMRGYWNDPVETALALKPWGLITGDLGYRDKDGFLYLTGRKKQMLKIGGERVSPKEIEDVLIESGLVHEAAVIGRPDEVLAEVPAAYIVPLDARTFDMDVLKQFTREHLAGHKIPRSWNLVRNLPKKPSGKIDKEALNP